MSQKYQLFADSPGQLQQRGMSRRNASILVTSQTTVTINGEWLEALWCEQCQETKWYYVHKLDERNYKLALAPRELWQQVAGVIHPQGNPSVGEFTRRHSRLLGCSNIKDFQFVN